jgi:enediyne biosynthesis protein E4
MICFFLSCHTDVTDSAAVFDASPYMFQEGTLSPPFRHINSIWAGVSLLDYDNDGWLDIFLSNGRSHPDALYQNQGDGTFIDVAQQAGVDARSENGATVAGDLDNDGDIDLIVNIPCAATTLSPQGEFLLDGNKILYHNQGDGTFTTEDFGLLNIDAEHLRHCTFSMTLADLNADSYLDLILVDGHDPDTVVPWAFDKFHPGSENIILFNDGTGHFSNLSSTMGSEGSFVAAHNDINNDGRMDLIFGHSGQHVEIYEQQENGDFTLRPSWSNSGRGLWMGLALADFDGDSEWEIYGTNQGLSPLILGYDNLTFALPNNVITQYSSIPNPTMWEEPTIVYDWLNPFHSMLQLEEGRIVLDTQWSFESNHLLAGDLYTDINYRYAYWEGVEGMARLPWGWDVVALDVDADGWMDIAYNGNACAAPMAIIGSEDQGAGPGGLLINEQGTGFVDRIWEAEIPNISADGQYEDGRSVAVGDLNNDGYPDLVFANRGHNPSDTNPLEQRVGNAKVWLSEPRDNHWLQIELQGTSSNREGIGAKVVVTTEQRVYTQWMRSGGKLGSSNQSMLHFGLADAEQVDVVVFFPSGVSVTKNELSYNQKYTIIEE